MGGIGIVGTGISGLQLALYLQQAGVDTTVYSPRTAEEIRAGRLPNLVVRWAPTIEREGQLGFDLRPEHAVGAMQVRVAGDLELSFCGRLAAPARATDFRIYLSNLLGHYEDRGGRVAVGPCEPAGLEALSRQHDLIVVAAGRDGFGGLFPRDPVRSPHTSPARHVAAGLYRGAAWPEPAGPDMTLVPGVGEIFELAFHSFDGPVVALSVEAIPGGPLDVLSGLSYDADPGAFEAALLGLLAKFAPVVFERVDRAAFGLTRPLDLLQGRLTPVVRKAWAPLADGKHAMAIGDAWILNDPIAAQGANLGSRCAFLMGAEIAAGGPYDGAFCRRIEAEMWAAAAAPTLLSNALLAPPPPEVLTALARAAHDQAAADRFVSGFGDPEGMLSMLSPEPAPCR
ncbi:MAG: monooxygenase [Actinobacteria bacterium]|nr:monooxygenase [Actinomycetota bacterium]